MIGSGFLGRAGQQPVLAQPELEVRQVHVAEGAVVVVGVGHFGPGHRSAD